jgi:hypothetical protein
MRIATQQQQQQQQRIETKTGRGVNQPRTVVINYATRVERMVPTVVHTWEKSRVAQ